MKAVQAKKYDNELSEREHSSYSVFPLPVCMKVKLFLVYLVVFRLKGEMYFAGYKQNAKHLASERIYSTAGRTQMKEKLEFHPPLEEIFTNLFDE